MAGVPRGEGVDCNNPTIFFTFQKNGRLTDIASLKQRVVDVSVGVPDEKVPETALNLADCPGGVRLGPGRYAASFQTDGTWNIGTHSIEWKFKETATSPEFNVQRRFEVLDEGFFSGGASYVGYASTVDLLGVDAVAADIANRQRLIDEVSRQIELLTARFFEPRFLEMKLDSRGLNFVETSHPIVGIEKISVENVNFTGVFTGTDVDLTTVRIYNRHLQGLLDPDDRDYPKVSFIEADPAVSTELEFIFPSGKQNAAIRGVFGYTDPDGSPFGRSPPLLGRVVQTLVARLLADPTSSDPLTSSPGRVRSMRTRDQSITFASARDGGIGNLTGDRSVDDLLIQYMRPMHMGAA